MRAKMRSRSKKSTNANTMGNGGIAGSGIFGMLGTTIHCNSDDNSLYCNFMKFVNFILFAILLLFIAYIVYSVFIAKKRR
jgi:hypothetical protein